MLLHVNEVISHGGPAGNSGCGAPAPTGVVTLREVHAPGRELVWCHLAESLFPDIYSLPVQESRMIYARQTRLSDGLSQGEERRPDD